MLGIRLWTADFVLQACVKSLQFSHKSRVKTLAQKPISLATISVVSFLHKTNQRCVYPRLPSLLLHKQIVLFRLPNCSLHVTSMH